MTKQKNKEKNIYRCEFLCGRIATGIIKITEKADLQLCDACRHLLDPDDKLEWIPFD
jgi:hypothetical protein